MMQIINDEQDRTGNSNRMLQTYMTTNNGVQIELKFDSLDHLQKRISNL